MILYFSSLYVKYILPEADTTAHTRVPRNDCNQASATVDVSYTLLSIQLEAAFSNKTNAIFVVCAKIEPEQANMFDANANLPIHIHVKMLFQFSYLSQNTHPV